VSIQLSDRVRNARLNAIETTIGTTPVLKIRTGAQPANCAAADSGTVLAAVNLPSDWMGNAASGVKSLAGTWADVGAAAGSAAHFRIYDSGGSTCDLQGSVTATGGGGDMEVDNVVFAVSQVFTVTSFTLTDGNG
jgi:hypothetical protein